MLEAGSLVDIRGHIQSVLVLNAFKLYCKLAAKLFTQAVNGQEPGCIDNEGDMAMNQGLSDGVSLPEDLQVDVHKLLGGLLELTNFLMDKISLFVHSANLEVQERVGSCSFNS